MPAMWTWDAQLQRRASGLQSDRQRGAGIQRSATVDNHRFGAPGSAGRSRHTYLVKYDTQAGTETIVTLGGGSDLHCGMGNRQSVISGAAPPDTRIGGRRAAVVPFS